MSASAVGIVPIILVILIKLALAFIPGNIAKKKGYSFGGFFVLGLFFFFIGLIVSVCLNDKVCVEYQAQPYQNYIPDVPVQNNNNIPNELMRYNNLLKQGAITQEEYDKVKAKLLNLQ